ncbi:LuxR C-terminal-related transcriptional regulator [Salinibacterium hongtaonis]|uniref:LuxR C-terminal-related transcriptional regulator n=1 Tax=Homoserinimonas hongtaonis TaxID=2079791 RepID=UPI000D399EF9|nr:LuxR C-terminal-related transcriptional regulator [Salinibacterium hongtaonis]AWB89742.1 hypothetical protein C2138_09515 [Salinibacterium hongtaonis]
MNSFWDRLDTSRLIDRPALRRGLDRSLGSRLTLVVAQAGAGKTTLLQQWGGTRSVADNSAGPTLVHLDIDESDDDPARFVRHLAAACPSARPSADILAATVETGLTGLGEPAIDAMALSLGSAQETVIIIDNLQRFSNVRLVADLGELIARSPRNAHFILSSRVDPPIALSRYRLHDDVLEIRQSDLAFDLAEAAELLTLLIGHRLSAEQVRALWMRTEGWVAGLQLAGLSLRNNADADAFIDDFSGSDRIVADYLSEEVLSSLSSEQRRLLLCMSVLDEISGELVDAITGSSGNQAVLDSLERESMFLVPLDHRHRWFRFHRLFSELLRSRLRAESPADELRILTSAAEWSLTHGRVKPAMAYLLRAQARDGALEAMLATAADVTEHDDSLDAIRWQPSSAEPSSPVAPAISERVDAEALTGARRLLTEPEHPAASQPATGLGFVAAQVLWRARPEVSPESAQRRLSSIQSQIARKRPESLPREAVGELIDALVSGGRAHFLAGHLGEARQWLSRALDTAGVDPVNRIPASSALALVEAWCGNAERANSLIAETLHAARKAEMLGHPAISDAYLASVVTAVGTDEAPQLFDEQPGETTGPAESQGTPAAGLNQADLGAEPSPPAALTVASSALFSRAVAALAAGETQSARAIATAWAQLVPSPDAISTVQHRILLAWLSSTDEIPAEATRHLTEAVKLAEVHGLVDIFIQAGPTILTLLETVTGPHASFSATIRMRAGQSWQPLGNRVLADPLTDRELEILAYLPTRFSNVDLARRFYLSVNTIKTHIAHIYRKLEVTDRDAAIGRARELGLL